MQELVKITINENGTMVVSAKELYDYLGYGSNNWLRWCKMYLTNNGLAIKNQDWGELLKMSNSSSQMSNSPVKGKGGKKIKDYAITLDFAKRLSMMAKTEKGEQVRRYFIECEKMAQQAALPVASVPMTRRQLLEMALEAENERDAALLQLNQANQTIMHQAPKVQFVDAVLQSKRTYTSTQVAKELDIPSAQRLHEILHERQIMFKQSDQWLLYAKYADKGFTKTRTHHYLHTNGTNATNTMTVWTEKGRAFLHQLLNDSLNLPVHTGYQYE